MLFERDFIGILTFNLCFSLLQKIFELIVEMGVLSLKWLHFGQVIRWTVGVLQSKSLIAVEKSCFSMQMAFGACFSDF